MKRPQPAALALLAAACATAPQSKSTLSDATAPAIEVNLPASVPQGGLLFGRATPGAQVRYGERALRVDADGRFVVGVSREQTGAVWLQLSWPDGQRRELAVPVVDREFPQEIVNGVPEQTVNPRPEIAARIEREQAAVNAARARDDARGDYAAKFIWPVQGRISGRFGSQRVYNGTPKSPHSGLDIAAAQGTAVQAPAAGVVTFADANLYLTGGTLLIDHGHGVSSNFLHLSRIDVKVGEQVDQGQVIGAVGATGRATGPHLHWGMNWFEVRVDPQLRVDAAENPQPPPP
jgi:murein DD-endopeptidase MepM/ murein hydrolase activator NlpD